MLQSLYGVVESFSTIGRVVANFFNGLLNLISLIGSGISILYNYVNILLPLPLRIIAVAIISVSVVFILVGRQH